MSGSESGVVLPYQGDLRKEPAMVISVMATKYTIYPSVDPFRPTFETAPM